MFLASRIKIVAGLCNWHRKSSFFLTCVKIVVGFFRIYSRWPVHLFAKAISWASQSAIFMFHCIKVPPTPESRPCSFPFCPCQVGGRMVSFCNSTLVLSFSWRTSAWQRILERSTAKRARQQHGMELYAWLRERPNTYTGWNKENDTSVTILNSLKSF